MCVVFCLCDLCYHSLFVLLSAVCLCVDVCECEWAFLWLLGLWRLQRSAGLKRPSQGSDYQRKTQTEREWQEAEVWGNTWIVVQIQEGVGEKIQWENLHFEYLRIWGIFSLKSISLFPPRLLASMAATDIESGRVSYVYYVWDFLEKWCVSGC